MPTTRPTSFTSIHMFSTLLCKFMVPSSNKKWFIVRCMVLSRGFYDAHEAHDPNNSHSSLMKLGIVPKIKGI